ncbi:MAG TPA: hypothetical protein VHB23_12595 [Devosiaceae bacterium]|jgi:uncharacterized membrane protein|nr:hypothetical protein [Devosiaceae bacterium]
MRTLLWLAAGVILGLILHLVVILALPAFASETVWSRIAALADEDKVVVLPKVVAGQPNPLQLDPKLAYAVCRVDLSRGPGVLNGTLPNAFWSLAIFNKAGAVVYSTTNRDGIGQNLNLGIFNPAQTHLLAEQRIEVADGLLIVESPTNDVFVVIRLAPPHEVERARYEAALSHIICGNIKQPG